MFNARQVLGAVVFASLVALFTAGHVSLAYGQSFAINPSPLQPGAGVDPGGTATSIIDLTASAGFDSPVSLSCVATSTQFTSNLPECTVSPSSQTPPANGPSITITTTGATEAGQYTITVTGTSGSETETAVLFLNVVEQGTQSYTLTVSKAISPGTVAPGSGAEATVTITPIASYTGHEVTLSCFSVTPVVVAAPICKFDPPTVAVNNGTAPTSVLTVSTYGTTGTTTQLATPHIFYAFWLALPALALIGGCASGGRRKKWLGLLFVMAVAGTLLFLPSCSSSNTTLNNPSGLVTPKNTYTFTLTGVDENGVTPSNTTTTTAQATVSLTVN